MGLSEFDEIFHTLDPKCKGYLEADAIQAFQQTLYFSPISEEHLSSAISQICGKHSDGKVYKKQFVPLLEELERRRSLEEKLRWDFFSLDYQGTCVISVQNALLLFKNTHNDRFSLHVWRKFLATRYAPEADVTFDEIKMWLINPIEGTVPVQNEYASEMERLDRKIQQNDEQEFKNYVQFQV